MQQGPEAGIFPNTSSRAERDGAPSEAKRDEARSRGTCISSTPETQFMEFRRKVREAEVLSAALVRLLTEIRFSGRISVVVQNGRVVRSGYEEGYFRQRE